MAKTKKSDNLEYCRGIRVMDVAVYVFALIFCSMFYWLMSKKKETVVTVAAK